MVTIIRNFPASRVDDPAAYFHYRSRRTTDQIFLGSTRSFETAWIDGALSVRSIDGAAGNPDSYCELEDRIERMSDREYSILNHGQRYRVNISTRQPATCFAVYFSPATAIDVYHGVRTAPLGRLLDPPTGSTVPVVHDRLYNRADTVGRELNRLRQVIGRTEELNPLWLEERVTELLARVFRGQAGIYTELDRLPAVRWSTRRELHRRLHRARDFIHANLHASLSTAGIAGVACMSPFHFQRTFRALFGAPVSQYVTRTRLHRAARELTERPDEPIQAVALRYGYLHHPSFTRAFRRHLGITPAAYRANRLRTIG